MLGCSVLSSDELGAFIHHTPPDLLIVLRLKKNQTSTLPSRNRCEEYRIHCKKVSEKELGDCQLAQQTLKVILRKEEEMQERKLEEICEKEQLAKDEKAELKAQEVAARIQEMVNVREAQLAVHAARREEQKQQIRKEAEWLVISIVFCIQACAEGPSNDRLTRRLD